MDLDRPEGWIHIPLRTTTVEEPDEGKEPRAEGELPKMREVDGYVQFEDCRMSLTLIVISHNLR